MTNDFWKDAEKDGDVLFPTSFAVAVYLNDKGAIVIRQQGLDPLGDDDAAVVVPSLFLDALVRSLNNLRVEADK